MNRHGRSTKSALAGRSQAGQPQRHRARNLERAVFWCLLLSVLLHGGLVALGAGAVPVPQLGAMAAEQAPPADSWVGETFDIDTAPTGAAGPSREVLPPGEPSPAKPAAAPPPVEPEPSPPATVEPGPPMPVEPKPSPTNVEPKPSPPTTVEPKPAAQPTSSKPLEAPVPPPTSTSAPSTASRPIASASAAPSALTGSAAAPSSSNQSPGRAHGSFGASGNRRGVRNLATAFARALPIAYSGDPVWTTMPLGPAGTLEVTLEVDEAGKIAGAKPTDAARAPQHLVRLVERTLLLLRAGRFSLSSADTNAGSETFRLEATIDQVEASPAEDRSNAGPYALGFQAPRPGVPGHATFTLQSGRRITIAVTMVADRRAPH